MIQEGVKCHNQKSYFLSYFINDLICMEETKILQRQYIWLIIFKINHNIMHEKIKKDE